jgi:hypothetical protein
MLSLRHEYLYYIDKLCRYNVSALHYCMSIFTSRYLYYIGLLCAPAQVVYVLPYLLHEYLYHTGQANDV